MKRLGSYRVLLAILFTGMFISVATLCIVLQQRNVHYTEQLNDMLSDTVDATIIDMNNHSRKLTRTDFAMVREELSVENIVLIHGQKGLVVADLVFTLGNGTKVYFAIFEDGTMSYNKRQFSLKRKGWLADNTPGIPRYGKAE